MCLVGTGSCVLTLEPCVLIFCPYAYCCVVNAPFLVRCVGGMNALSTVHMVGCVSSDKIPMHVALTWARNSAEAASDDAKELAAALVELAMTKAATARAELAVADAMRRLQARRIGVHQQQQQQQIDQALSQQTHCSQTGCDEAATMSCTTTQTGGMDVNRKRSRRYCSNHMPVCELCEKSKEEGEGEEEEGEEDKEEEEEDYLVLCGGGWGCRGKGMRHVRCLQPGLSSVVPSEAWLCKSCEPLDFRQAFQVVHEITRIVGTKDRAQESKGECGLLAQFYGWNEETRAALNGNPQGTTKSEEKFRAVERECALRQSAALIFRRVRAWLLRLRGYSHTHPTAHPTIYCPGHLLARHGLPGRDGEPRAEPDPCGKSAFGGVPTIS